MKKMLIYTSLMILFLIVYRTAFDNKEYLGSKDSEGNPHGRGTLITNEYTVNAFFEHGTIDYLKPICRKNNDSIFYGYLSKSKTGFGETTFFKDGSTYIGYFKNGSYDGFGSYELAIGDNYIGLFKNNKFNGFGEYTFKKSKNFQYGNFINGEFGSFGKQIFFNPKNIYIGDLMWLHLMRHRK